MKALTTFIIPSINRPTLDRAIASTNQPNFTFLIKIDEERVGEGVIRNELIKQAETEWVSFVDDDDTVTSDYVQRLEEEIAAHPEADVIHFREYFLRGFVLPSWPVVEWGNVCIAYSVKREIAMQYPFQSEPYEDYEFIKRLHEAGKTIYFSNYLTYRERH
jgi:glycosyltransferase involved in cell wall biosynthesis